jgi:hypothetical protein
VGEHSNELAFYYESNTKGANSLGGSGLCPQKIRTLEMSFPVIWTLDYELQFHLKKGKTLEIMPCF